MRRIVIALSAAGLALAIAGVAYLALSLDAWVERRIESEGTRILGAPVQVGAVDLELSRGVGTIRDLRVENPDGFSNREAFELEEIELTVDVGTLRESPVRLSSVRIEETEVNLALDERGRSNLDAILRHAREQPARDPEADPGEARLIRIDSLRFAGGTIRLERPGAEAADELALPSFERSDIGGASGAPGGEIAKVLTHALVRQVAASAAGHQVRGAVERELGGEAGKAAGAVVRGLLGD